MSEKTYGVPLLLPPAVFGALELATSSWLLLLGAVLAEAASVAAVVVQAERQAARVARRAALVAARRAVVVRVEVLDL